jgi:LytS/YehU family sensor histidine kinase
MKRRKMILWIILTCLIFVFFRWLFGMAMPEIALQFSLGTTVIMVGGLVIGHSLTLLALRTNAISNIGTAIFLMTGFILVGFVTTAYLLNAMVQKTALLPFAITVLLVFLVTAAAGGLVTIIRHHYKSNIRSAQSAMAQSRAELQLLQSQLSPHFLFNTLNNLYGLSMTEPDRIPPLLLKLSELLRYSVYDAKDILVPVQNEVEYIQNYIEFQRLRLGERLDLKIDIDHISSLECKIPPLMLIVFVENAFKHSRTTGKDIIRIDLTLRKRDDRIDFSISNSCTEKSVGGPEKHSGFGLDSVSRRLNLLYPDRHKLRIDQSESVYIVHLELPCQ